MVVHDVILDAGHNAGSFCFRSAAAGQLDTTHLVMSGVPVCYGYEADVVTESGVFDGDPACFDVAVVGMGANDENSELVRHVTPGGKNPRQLALGAGSGYGELLALRMSLRRPI